MINPFHANYLTPTKDFRQLSVLLAIHSYPDISQHNIGKQTHLSSSMVNNYIKEFKQNGYIYVKGDTNRTYAYYLTSMGKDLLVKSMIEYSAELVQLYAGIKKELAGMFNTYYDEGIRTVVLYGIADTAEIVYTAIKETPLVVIGVVDTDIKKHNKPFNGLIIQPPDRLLKMKPDAILITSFGRQEEIYHSLTGMLGDQIIIKKLSIV